MHKKINNWARRADIIFLVVSIPAVILFAFMVPAGWGLDEQVHAGRVYQISTGILYPVKYDQDSEFSVKLPLPLKNSLELGHIQSNAVDRSRLFYERKDMPSADWNHSIVGRPINNIFTDLYNITPTAIYSPVVYFPAAAGMKMGTVLNLSVEKTITLSRLIQATFFVALCWVGIYVLRYTKLKWILLTILLLPATIYQAATLNADAYSIAAVTFFSAVVIKAALNRKKFSKKELILIPAATLILAFAKPTYLLVVFLLLIIPTQKFKTPILSYAAKTVFLILAVGVAVAAYFIGLKYSGSTIYLSAETARSISATGQIWWTVTHPLEFMKILTRTLVSSSNDWGESFVAALGYNQIKAPFILIVPSIVSITIAVLNSADSSRNILRRKFGLTLAFAGLTMSGAVIFALYATYNPVGSESIFGVQGRYFLPAAIVFCLGVGMAIQGKVELNTWLKASFLVGFPAIVLYAMVAAYYIALI